MTLVNRDHVKLLFTELSADDLIEYWPRLHAGDQEPLPTTQALTAAWLAFHNGQFDSCIELCGERDDAVSLKLKASSTFAYYLESDPQKQQKAFRKVATLAATALTKNLPHQDNLHYQLAYSLGRYGQSISIAKALAEGIAGKIASSLKQCLALQPKHADAHTSLATYQAELIGKLGKIAAKVTYHASTDEAIEWYEQGIALAPHSISAKTEYAHGLQLMFGRRKRQQVVDLMRQSVIYPPIDALEAMDYDLAEKALNDL